MEIITLHIDGTVGIGRTEILTCTATDTLLFVDHGDQQHLLAGNLLIVSISPSSTVLMYSCLQRYHLDGLSRTFTGTEATRLSILHGNAVVTNPRSTSYLNGSALLYRHRLDGSCGAHLGTAVALGTAIAMLEAYLGLHETLETVTGTQHVVGTLVDTQLASRAVRGQVTCRERSWRNNQFLTLWFFLGHDVGITTVYGLLLDGVSNRGTSQQSQTGEYGPTISILGSLLGCN